jgi:hypothetical protein
MAAAGAVQHLYSVLPRGPDGFVPVCSCGYEGLLRLRRQEVSQLAREHAEGAIEAAGEGYAGPKCGGASPCQEPAWMWATRLGPPWEVVPLCPQHYGELWAGGLIAPGRSI